MLEKNNSNNTE